MIQLPVTFKKVVLIRLKFIEAMIVEYGYASRRQLMHVFEVESATASKDLAMYAQLNPTVVNNHSKKRWEPTEDFKPVEGLLAIPTWDYITLVCQLFDVQFIKSPTVPQNGIKRITI